MGRKTSVYLSEATLAALAADGRPLAEVITAGLSAQPAPVLRVVPLDELRAELAAMRTDDTPAASLRCDSCGTPLACPHCYRGED